MACFDHCFILPLYAIIITYKVSNILTYMQYLELILSSLGPSLVNNILFLLVIHLVHEWNIEIRLYFMSGLSE